MLKPKWVSPHFHSDEFRCHDMRGTAVPARFMPNVKRLAAQLEIIRAACGGKPVIVRSGYRTRDYNKAIGGAKASQHLSGSAADIVVVSMTPKQVHAVIEKLIAAGVLHNGGLGLYKNFVHYDIRAKPARWRG